MFALEKSVRFSLFGCNCSLEIRIVTSLHLTPPLGQESSGSPSLVPRTVFALYCFKVILASFEVLGHSVLAVNLEIYAAHPVRCKTSLPRLLEIQDPLAPGLQDLVGPCFTTEGWARGEPCATLEIT